MHFIKDFLFKGKDSLKKEKIEDSQKKDQEEESFFQDLSSEEELDERSQDKLKEFHIVNKMEKTSVVRSKETKGKVKITLPESRYKDLKQDTTGELKDTLINQTPEKDSQFYQSKTEILNPFEVKNSGRPLSVRRIPTYFEIYVNKRKAEQDLAPEKFKLQKLYSRNSL